VKRDQARGVRYFILEQDGIAAGCAALEMASAKVAYLERLSVLPSRRKQGIGRDLVEHILEEARRAGAQQVSIAIIAAQTELKRWYQQIGFVEGETRSYEHLPFQVTFLALEFVAH
jgi:N-acetylglutamate synthase-like GNAT family acetyltransferase